MFGLKTLTSIGIGSKLTVGFGLLVGITLLVVGFGFAAGLSATRNIGLIEKLQEPILNATTETQANLLKEQLHMRGYLVSGNIREAEQYEVSRKSFEKHLNVLKSLLMTSKSHQDRRHIAELEVLYREWAKLPPRLFALHDNPLENQVGLQLSRVEVLPLRTQVLYEIGEISKERGRSSGHRAFLKNLDGFRMSFDAMAADVLAFAASGEKSFRLAYGTHADANSAAWDRVLAHRPSLSVALRTKLDVIGDRRAQVVAFAQKISAIMAGDRTHEDLYVYRSQAVPQAERMMALLGEVTKSQQELLRKDLHQARHSLETARAQTLTGGLIAVLFGIGMAYLLRRNIVDTLHRLTAVAGQIAGGDLSITARVESGDEIGVLAAAINAMTQRLIETIRNLEAAFAEAQQAKGQTEVAYKKLHAAQDELVDVARRAGMAEIASNVLHNVGNVLNSVNVSADVIGRQMRTSRAIGLNKAVQLINGNIAQLGDYLTLDEKGKLLPDYLTQLAKSLATEQRVIIEEIGVLTKSIDHIKQIVATQQSFAGAPNIVEPVQIRDLVEDALRMNVGSLERHDITVVRQFAEVPVLPLDRHRVLQVLVNLISNAKQAMAGGAGQPHRMTLRIDVAGGENGRKLNICVADEGEGIAANNLTRIFNHGFTTRATGHGFGLHSCAIAAREMGGTLTAHSDGPGQGAAFTLELPIQAAKA